MNILLSLPLLSLLLIPPNVRTPQHKIDVEHFGHWFDESSYDKLLDSTARTFATEHSLPADNWAGHYDGKVRVIQQVEYVPDSSTAPAIAAAPCVREVQWAAVKTFLTDEPGFTVVINPRLLATDAFAPAVQAAFRSMMEQETKWAPQAQLSEECAPVAYAPDTKVGQ